MSQRTQAELLIAEMNRQGMHDNDLRAGTAAICGGESGLRPQTERSYRSTSNARIRRIFGSRVRHLSDSELSNIKHDDAAFFELVYGAHNAVGRALGNTEPGDGYKYIGRGIIQLTGKANYTRYSALTGYDLVGNPELANDPQVAAATAVAYMLDRYKGGGWDQMKAAVGNSFGAPDAEKNRLYALYTETGEFDYRPQPVDTDELGARLERLEGMAQGFKELCARFSEELKSFNAKWS